MEEEGRMKCMFQIFVSSGDVHLSNILTKTYQKLWMIWWTSSILTLYLQQSATYHFRKTILYDTVNWV